jgi:hypothetical protein
VQWILACGRLQDELHMHSSNCRVVGIKPCAPVWCACVLPPPQRQMQLPRRDACQPEACLYALGVSWLGLQVDLPCLFAADPKLIRAF